MNPPGRIVTFYSYKGGVGRSMLLANIAWIFATNGKRVMVIDWDLEAPGLHRYFHPFLDDGELLQTQGLIDFLVNFSERAIREPQDSQWYVPHSNLLPYAVSLDCEELLGGCIDFVPAGRQDAGYSIRVNSFDWTRFYAEFGGGIFLEAVKKRLREEYDYILIDSRTGVSDTSGICTVQMPDDLVVCFTLNTQSMAGAAAVALSASNQRVGENGRPSLRVWPVPTRLDPAEKEKMEFSLQTAWRMFDRCLERLPPNLRENYWERIGIPYQPFYAYEEVLAAFADWPLNPKSLLPSMEALAECIADGAHRMGTLSDHYRKKALARFSRLEEPIGELEPVLSTAETVSGVRTVFLSSTGVDLREYRVRAFEAIQKLDHWTCVRSEDFGERDKPVDEFCREMARRCDLFVGIIGHRFGDVPKGSKESFTLREYRAAVAAEKPVLLFVAPNDFPVPANLLEPTWKTKEQLRFRNELSDSRQKILSIGFSSPDHLATQIVMAIYHWDRERSIKPEGIDATSYLEALWEETAWIDIRGLRVANEAVHRFRIDQLYTPLTTVLASTEDRKKLEQALPEQRVIPLQRALENKRLVLVGDPGAGKSTFLRRIAFAACETLLGRNPLAADELIPRKPCPLPLLIRAATLASYIHSSNAPGLPVQNDSLDWIGHFLSHETKLDAAFFRQQLDTGCLLLLDGLDEIPDSIGRKAMARLLDRAARTWKNTLLVATSRPSAYGGETVIPGFVTIQIGPLEPKGVETFVANWCRALHADEEKNLQHQAELLDAIRSRPEIEELAVNPVMLTALAALHWNRMRLPDQRSELYESVLTWLARAREETRKDKSAGLSPVECLGLMQHLAWSMHSDPKGRQTEITKVAAARLLAPRFRNIAADEQLAAAERFLNEEEIDSGILISRGNMLRFWHLTFQEYLAAKALARRDTDRRKLLFTERKLYQPEWRETVLLLTGVLCKEDVDSVDAFFREVLDDLGANPSLSERARCVGLMGSILQDLRSWGYRIADTRYQENLGRVLAIFDPSAARTLVFQSRLEAANALGQAGDPRLQQDNWVPVAGGPFWMGAQKTDPKGTNYDPQAYNDESPVHLVELATFEMGRYPVTVTEYARFVEVGGYDKEALWHAGGFGRLAEPDAWQGQLRYPNRPVVGLNWYEAMAYCAWTETRLPSEEEWEYAARGGREGFRYPWGNQAPDETRANFDSTPGHPTPVGLYPNGATPSGIDDMAGNVYEWMADWWREDYSNAQPSETGKNMKVIRGGAWLYDSWNLRVSGRGSFQPDGRDGEIGFRCVRSPRGRE